MVMSLVSYSGTERNRLEETPETFYFFFSSRRRHTRSDRDWSSDVCSSDLDGQEEPDARVRAGCGVYAVTGGVRADRGMAGRPGGGAAGTRGAGRAAGGPGPGDAPAAAAGSPGPAVGPGAAA